MHWSGRRREEGGSELIAHIRVIQVLPVADNWIDEDDISLGETRFGLNKTATKNILPDTYGTFLALN